MATSLDIARRFGKEHKIVLRDIQELELRGCDKDFIGYNFVPVDYMDSKGEKRPMYRMTRDGFSLLVMGFAGKKAMAWLPWMRWTG